MRRVLRDGIPELAEKEGMRENAQLKNQLAELCTKLIIKGRWGRNWMNEALVLFPQAAALFGLFGGSCRRIPAQCRGRGRD